MFYFSFSSDNNYPALPLKCLLKKKKTEKIIDIGKQNGRDKTYQVLVNQGT